MAELDAANHPPTSSFHPITALHPGGRYEPALPVHRRRKLTVNCSTHHYAVVLINQVVLLFVRCLCVRACV